MRAVGGYGMRRHYSKRWIRLLDGIYSQLIIGVAVLTWVLSGHAFTLPFKRGFASVAPENERAEQALLLCDKNDDGSYLCVERPASIAP